jgi:ADP-heptose:LPS heptosyltransferase
VRVLLVRAGALGDLLLLRRTIAALRAAGHAVSLLAPRAGAVLLGPGPSEVDEWLDYEGPETAGLLAGSPPGSLGERLREAEAVLAFTRSVHLVRALRGVGRRLVVRDPTPAAGHASLWLAEAARALGADGRALPPDMQPTPAEATAAAAVLETLPRAFLALHPGSGSPAKNWPAHRFPALARTLSPDRPWLLVRGPADQAAVRALGEAGPGIDPGPLPLRVLGTVLREAGRFVGNDSGVSHLAAAFGARTVALFGPTDPETWGPVGRSVVCLRSPDGTMEGLSLSAVLAATANR